MSETIDAVAESETGTALAVIRTALPTILAADQNDILGKLAAKVASHKSDISTAKGRDAIRSLAAEIASSKVTLVKLGKSLTEDWRAKTKAVNAECNVIEERMDALKDQVRRPLTEFENAEKNRIADHEQAIQSLAVDPAMEYATSEEISAAIAWRLEPEARNWQEFHQRAIDAHAAAIATLRRWRAAAEQREEEAAELARLRAEQAERDRIAALEAQAKREADIAAAAAEAARREAEAKAARDAAAAAEALAAAERRAEQEREVARQTAERAEAKRLADHQVALNAMKRLAEPLAPPDAVVVIDGKIARLADVYDREWEEFDTEASVLFAECAAVLKTARATSERISAEAEARRQAAENARQERDKAAAVEEERKRAAEAKRAEDAMAAARAENVAHQRKINGEVLADMLAAIEGMPELPAEDGDDIGTPIAKAIIKAIARGEVRHVVVQY